MRKRGINVHTFLEGYGVRCQPVRYARDPRPPNIVYGGRLIARMLRRLGPDRTGLVVSCVLASNRSALLGDVLWAVSLFIAVHRPASSLVDLKREFSAIDLVQLRGRAHALSIGAGGSMSSKSRSLATLIAIELLEKQAA